MSETIAIPDWAKPVAFTKALKDLRRRFVAQPGPLVEWNEMRVGWDMAVDHLSLKNQASSDSFFMEKLRAYYQKLRAEKSMQLLAAAVVRGETDAWARPVIISPACPYLVLVPSAPRTWQTENVAERYPYAIWTPENTIQPPRVHVILDDSLRQWARRPRSKKRRIQRKWRQRVENWQPSKQVYVARLSMGRQHQLRPVLYLMHPDRWEMMKAENPTWAASCQVTKRFPHETNRHDTP